MNEAVEEQELSIQERIRVLKIINALPRTKLAELIARIWAKKCQSESTRMDMLNYIVSRFSYLTKTLSEKEKYSSVTLSLLEIGSPELKKKAPGISSKVKMALSPTQRREKSQDFSKLFSNDYQAASSVSPKRTNKGFLSIGKAFRSKAIDPSNVISQKKTDGNDNVKKPNSPFSRRTQSYGFKFSSNAKNALKENNNESLFASLVNDTPLGASLVDLLIQVINLDFEEIEEIFSSEYEDIFSDLERKQYRSSGESSHSTATVENKRTRLQFSEISSSPFSLVSSIVDSTELKHGKDNSSSEEDFDNDSDSAELPYGLSEALAKRFRQKQEPSIQKRMGLTQRTILCLEKEVALILSKEDTCPIYNLRKFLAEESLSFTRDERLVIMKENSSLDSNSQVDSKPSNSFSLNSLELPILLRVFSFLPTSIILAKIRTLNYDFFKICNCNAVWNQFSKFSFVNDWYSEVKSDIAPLLSRLANVHSLSIPACFAIQTLQELALTKPTHLNELVLSRIKRAEDLSNLTSFTHLNRLIVLNSSGFNDSFLENAFTKDPQLWGNIRFLNLTDCAFITNKGVSMIVKSCGVVLETLVLALESLVNQGVVDYLNDSGIESVAENCPNLKVLNVANRKFVSGSSLVILASNCCILEELNISGLPLITDKDLREIFFRLKSLLKFHYCNSSENVTDYSLYALTETKTRLTMFSMTQNSNISDEGMVNLARASSETLSSLNISNCCRIQESSLVSFAVLCKNLVDLHFDYSPDHTIQIISKVLPGLESLQIEDAKKMSEISLEAIGSFKKLKTLKLKQFQKLSLSAVEHLAKLNNTLENLNLSHLIQVDDASISSLSQHFSKLLALNLESCAKLSESMIIMLLSGKFHTNIRSLSFEYVPALTDKLCNLIGICLPSLSKLDLSNCINISNEGAECLIKSSNKLKTLSLRGTRINDALLSAFPNPLPNLAILDLKNCSEISYRACRLLETTHPDLLVLR